MGRKGARILGDRQGNHHTILSLAFTRVGNAPPLAPDVREIRASMSRSEERIGVRMWIGRA